MESDGYNQYKVPREELPLPADFEFERKTYRGETDDRRKKVRIREDPTPGVEERKTALARLGAKYEIDLSKAAVEQEADGTYVLLLGNKTAGDRADNPAAQKTPSPTASPTPSPTSPLTDCGAGR